MPEYDSRSFIVHCVSLLEWRSTQRARDTKIIYMSDQLVVLWPSAFACLVCLPGWFTFVLASLSWRRGLEYVERCKGPVQLKQLQLKTWAPHCCFSLIQDGTHGLCSQLSEPPLVLVWLIHLVAALSIGRILPSLSYINIAWKISKQG